MKIAYDHFNSDLTDTVLDNRELEESEKEHNVENNAELKGSSNSSLFHDFIK